MGILGRLGAEPHRLEHLDYYKFSNVERILDEHRQKYPKLNSEGKLLRDGIVYMLVGDIAESLGVTRQVIEGIIKRENPPRVSASDRHNRVAFVYDMAFFEQQQIVVEIRKLILEGFIAEKSGEWRNFFKYDDQYYGSISSIVKKYNAEHKTRHGDSYIKPLVIKCPSIRIVSTIGSPVTAYSYVAVAEIMAGIKTYR